MVKSSKHENPKQTEFIMRRVDDLIPYARNARTHSPEQVAKIAGSIKEFGFLNPVIISEDGGILAGHGRVLAAKKIGLDEVPCIMESHLTETQRRAYILADNRLALDAGWDDELLRLELEELSNMDVDLSSLGFSNDELSSIIDNMDNDLSSISDDAHHSLSESFLLPPFSILDSTSLKWQTRKRSWINIGIKSELGRDGNLLFNDLSYLTGKNKKLPDSSIFDPVLCEILCLWFSAKGSVIFDPFAGGSVRGIVSTYLGRRYTGIDLRKEQVDANIEQAKQIQCDEMPNWIVGDSLNQDELVPNLKADMILTCPPYADLEKYSNDPRDLSNMKYPEFIKAYREIIRKSCERLDDNRFAAIIVGEVRDKKGNYYGFVKDTIKAFADAGMDYYNEFILVNAIGNLALRTRKQFESSRKTGKRHQNVLIFVKGDAKKATEYCGPVEIADFEIDSESEE